MTPSLLGGVKVLNSADLINEDTKMNVLLYSGSKLGKTSCAATLDAMTKKFHGKPSLFIAAESADGGGTMSVQHLGVDYVMPSSWAEFTSIVAALQADRKYGGVILDNISDLVKRFVMPYALAMPYTKSKNPPASRALGVPEQGDYQTAGELVRGAVMNPLMNLTKAKDLNCRKHLIVVALEKTKTDRESGNTTRIGPDLPGAMMEDSSAMFQTVASLAIKTGVEAVDASDPKKGTRRTSTRFLVTAADGLKILGDRTHCFPKEGPTDLCGIWEEYFMPKIKVNRERLAGGGK